MKQIGIIYKFTIVGKYEFDGHKPFYIGQHFGLDDFDTYIGSGSIWGDFITKLKSDFPFCWRKFIKREILYQRPCSQKVLDKLEEHFIKREKSHYSYKLGGCNVLWGTANEFGSGSPMKDPMVRKKQSKSMKRTFAENPELVKEINKKRQWSLDNTNYKEKISKTLKGRYVGKSNPNFGNKWTEEQKDELSNKMKGRYIGKNNPNFGNKWTEEQKEKLSNKMRRKSRKSGYINPMSNKVRITNDIINTVIKKGEPLPEGFRFGMKKRKQ